MSALSLSEREAAAIIRNMQGDFRRRVAGYDTSKYPPGVLRFLRSRFSEGRVEQDVMDLALMWKFGHLHKPDYPAAHKKLAVRLMKRWEKAPLVRGVEQPLVFDEWQRAFPTAFVTLCFLQHLVEPKRTPILDRFNLMAVGHHLSQVGSTIRVHKSPRTLSDLETVKAFINTVQERWQAVTKSPEPSFDEVDRYLMVLGQELSRL